MFWGDNLSKPNKIGLNIDWSASEMDTCSSTDGKVLSVLIADDDETNRIVLENMLHREGHTVHLAKDGREAVALYKSLRPDLVLMDVMMPILDGYEATRQIKTIAGNHFVPITFLTALTDESSLIKCLEVGGDDFIVKPVSRSILKAKLYAAARIHGLYANLQRQQHDLSIQHERLSYEFDIAEKIFSKVIGSIGSKAANIRSEILPLAIANGDLMLAAQTPAGAQYVMLGDYTGHGLSAAIGAIPVADIFYAMAKKGLELREIVCEMNRKLHAVLPTGQFLAACMVEWMPRRGVVRIWNAGLPDVILASGDRQGLARIPSRNLPLGIMGNEEFRAEIDVRQISHGDRLFLCSDGLIDARNKEGEMFGEGRLQEIVHSNDDRNKLFDEILEEVATFRGQCPQDDDMAMVEILCDSSLFLCEEKIIESPRRRPDYELSIRLGSLALSNFDPLCLVEGLIKGVAALKHHRSYLYTIIAELYANALEHGVLAMDCSVKETPEGFARYYEERGRLLSELIEGWVHIDIECFGNDLAGEVVLQIEDSGKGFDFSAVTNDIHGEAYAKTSGRGMELVRALCKSMDYDLRGNYLRAVYAW